MLFITRVRFDVYRAPIDFLGQAYRLVAGFPRGHSDLAGASFRRAATSIPLNIAEAQDGRTGDADRREKTYAIARGSAMEVAAVLDVCFVMGLVDEGQRRRGSEYAGTGGGDAHPGCVGEVSARSETAADSSIYSQCRWRRCADDAPPTGYGDDHDYIFLLRCQLPALSSAGDRCNANDAAAARVDTPIFV